MTTQIRRAMPLPKLFMLFLPLFLASCYATVQNVKPDDDLAGKKILAGRILFYDDDRLVFYDHSPDGEQLRPYVPFFNENGDKEGQALIPDEQGFVYVPVVPGKYNFAFVKVGSFNFNLPTFPSVTVGEEDSVVNFGTLNYRFHQSAGSKVAMVLVGAGRGYLKVDHTADHDVIAPEIAARVGAERPVTNGTVKFLVRKKATR